MANYTEQQPVKQATDPEPTEVTVGPVEYCSFDKSSILECLPLDLKQLEKTALVTATDLQAQRKVDSEPLHTLYVNPVKLEYDKVMVDAKLLQEIADRLRAVTGKPIEVQYGSNLIFSPSEEKHFLNAKMPSQTP